MSSICADPSVVVNCSDMFEVGPASKRPIIEPVEIGTVGCQLDPG